MNIPFSGLRGILFRIGAVSLVIVALIVATPRAEASTVAELQARIEALRAELARIQSGSAADCFEFNRDIALGSTGSDVVALQEYLKTAGYFSMTVGASGNFGEITRTAVAAWQATNGLSPASGYFGKLSRARYEALCRLNGVVTASSDDDDDFGAAVADEAIDAASKAIDDARQQIDDADDNGDDVGDANDLLDRAEVKLGDAREALDDDDAEAAEKLANEAADTAGDAVDAIDEGTRDTDSAFIRGTARSPVGDNQAEADFELEFRLTAFDGSFYIPRSLERDDNPSDGSDGFEYVIDESDGTVYTGGSTIGNISASGSNSGDTSGYFKISDGKTRTFTIKVFLDNEGETSGFYGLQLKAIRFDDNTTAGGEQTLSTGLSSYETDHVFVGDTN